MCLYQLVSYKLCKFNLYYDRGAAKGMEMDVCAAYGQVTKTQSAPLPPAEKVYDNI